MYLHIIYEIFLICLQFMNIVMVQNFELMFDKFYVGKIHT
jgi:hypothetical protein